MRGGGFGALYRGVAPATTVAAASGPLAADTFTRANAAALGTSPAGHVWDEHGTAWTIVSNKAHPPNVVGYTVATLDAGATAVTVTVTVTPDADCDLGLAARVVDTSNFVFLDISRSGDHYVSRTFQRVAGSFAGLTTLVDPVTSISDVAAPFTLTLTVNGQAGESLVNDVSMGTWSSLDSGLLAATTHGLAVGATNVNNAFDDLTIEAA